MPSSSKMVPPHVLAAAPRTQAHARFWTGIGGYLTEVGLITSGIISSAPTFPPATLLWLLPLHPSRIVSRVPPLSQSSPASVAPLPQAPGTGVTVVVGVVGVTEPPQGELPNAMLTA